MIASRIRRALVTASFALAFAAAPITIHAGLQASIVAAKEAESGGKHAEPGENKGGRRGDRTGGNSTGKTSGDPGGKKDGNKGDDKGRKTGGDRAGDDHPGAHNQTGKKK